MGEAVEKLSQEEIQRQEEKLREDQPRADVVDIREQSEPQMVDTEDSPQVKMIKAEKLFDDASQAYERIQDASEAFNEAKTDESRNAAGEELRDAKKVMPGIDREKFGMLTRKFKAEIGDKYMNSPQREVLKMMMDKMLEEMAVKIEIEKKRREEEANNLFEQARSIYERINDAEQTIKDAKTDETRRFAQEELSLAEEEMPVIDGSTFSFLENKLKNDLGEDYKGSEKRKILYKMAEISVRPEELSKKSKENEPKYKLPEPAEVMGVEIEFCRHGKEVQYCSECRAIKDALESVGVKPFKE